MDASAENEIATTRKTGMTHANAINIKMMFSTIFVGTEIRLKRSNPVNSFLFIFRICFALFISTSISKQFVAPLYLIIFAYPAHFQCNLCLLNHGAFFVNFSDHRIRRQYGNAPRHRLDKCRRRRHTRS